MGLILNIDTALETASVCLSQNGEVCSIEKNTDQKDHAAWLHSAIERSFALTNMEISALDAVGVIIGPGSYTGLRVGLATAKGICFALDKPLITCSTLYNMALALIKPHTEFLCPMIDARRDEVYAALYRVNGHAEVMKPAPMILNKNSFEQELERHTITFFGNGSPKFKTLCNNPNAVFQTAEADASCMSEYIEKQFSAGNFADLVTTEPLYLKEFNAKVQ